jgi:hypothetical protein
MGKARGVSLVTGNDEREQTLNQLLAEMDGFDPNQGGHHHGRHQQAGDPRHRTAPSRWSRSPDPGGWSRHQGTDRGKSLDYLNQQAGKLRETADVIMQQRKKLITCKGSNSVDHSTESEKQKYQENSRENLGG